MARARSPHDPCCPAAERVSCFGVRFEVGSASSTLLRKIRTRLPPSNRRTSAFSVGRRFAIRTPTRRCACGQRHDTIDILVNGHRLTSSASEGAAIETLRLLIKQYVAEFAPHRVFVHAGVVAIGGRGVLIPGRSRSGKTTLVAALLRAGAVYYSDEYAVIGTNGLVRPFPQPLGMRTPGTLDQRDVPATDLGATMGRAPLRVALVLATQFEPGVTWRPTRLTAAGTVMAMLAHTVGAQRYPKRALSALAAAASGAIGWRGPRGDADDTAARIVARLARLDG